MAIVWIDCFGKYLVFSYDKDVTFVYPIIGQFVLLYNVDITE